MEISLGPYSVDLARSYVASIQRDRVLQDDSYLDLDEYFEFLNQPPSTHPGHILDINVRPATWDDDHFGQFHPCRLLRTKLPSRMRSSGQAAERTVVIMFSRVRIARANNRYHYLLPELNKILGFCCGSSLQSNPCFMGARTNACCAHVASLLVLSFHLAHHVSGMVAGNSDWKGTTRYQPGMDIRRDHFREDLAMEGMEHISS